MNIKNIDKLALAKAIGILCISWTALPILYYMFKKEKEDENGEEKSRGSDDQSEGTSSV